MVANRELHNAGVHRDSGSWVVRDGRWWAFILGNAVVAEHELPSEAEGTQP